MMQGDGCGRFSFPLFPLSFSLYGTVMYRTEGNISCFYVRSDAPEAPENLQASDVHADHLKLSWLPPSDDGGSDITGRLYTLFCFVIFLSF